MANQVEMTAHYDYFGALHELRLEGEGSTRDYTCAFFDGDFSLSLNEAQKRKHDWVLKGINFKAGDRVLDIGCGWGPMLETITKHGGHAVGLTLSPHQLRYCRNHGYDARLQDYKTVDRIKLGKFNGVISIGAFEHFCSQQEFKAGKQEQIYKEFFSFCADLLPKGGRLYLQTMTWGDNMPAHDIGDPNAPTLSKEATIYRLEQFYPGSWLPEGLQQVIMASLPYFELKGSKNGKTDYIKTLDHWDDHRKHLLRPSKFARAVPLIIKILSKAGYDPNMRAQIRSVWYNDQQRCFQNGWMSHERMFFEKKN